MNSQAAIRLDEVSSLLDDASAERRVQVLQTVTEQYNENKLSLDERKLAEQIFRVLMHDAESKVRQALSHQLKEGHGVPKDIILQLVDDIDDVALPVLQFSEVLTDDDLMQIIKNSGSSERLMAVSNRNKVSENVSDALVDSGDKKVVKNLLQRTVVKISEFSLSKVIGKFGQDKEVMESLSNRDTLPVSVVEKLIQKVSGAMQEKIVQKYGHKIPNIQDVVKRSQEAATLKFMGVKSTDAELRHLVDGLQRTGSIAQEIYVRNIDLTQEVERLDAAGRLTPISALCMGNLELFEISVARIINVPVANVRKLLADVEGKGFEAVYEKAKLPPTLRDATKLISGVIRQLDKEALENKAMKKTANALISRILATVEAEKQEVENLSYYISMIHQHAKLSPHGDSN